MIVDSRAPTQDGLLRLAPSLGFFGGSEIDRLDIAVEAKIVSLRIFIDDPDPQYLNLRGIEFRDKKGKLDLSKRNPEFRQSSVQKGHAGRSGRALLEKKGIHSDKELRPFWEIRLDAPVMVDHVRLFNRADAWGVRSRHLVVEVEEAGGRRREIHRAQSRDSFAQSLSVLRGHVAVGEPPIGTENEAEVVAWRKGVMAGLLAHARNPSSRIGMKAWRHLIAFTPAWIRGDASDDEMTIYAAYLMAQKRQKPNFATTVKLFAHTLCSREILDRFSDILNKLASLKEMPPVMLTRHGIRQVGMLRLHSERYLSHLRRVMSALDAMGYPAVLAYGTLLGAVRDGRFIEHDDDLDVIYKARSNDRAGVETEVVALAARLEKEGFKVVNLLPKHLNMHVIDPGTATSLDVFPCWIEGGELKLHMEGMAIRGIAPGIVFPAGSVDLEGVSLPAPADPAGFLAERYGDDWKIPDAYHDWPWKLK